jgi:Protein of unknown function (DUF2855)
MANTGTHIHVVSKHDNAKHASFQLESQMLPLAASSLRVRTRLIAITFNNLTYAQAGSFLHWWDTYPVPESAPRPYNNRDDWGIVPAWGYGEVIESKIDTLPPGSTLWGFWPTSAFPVDLKLESIEPKGHWREVTAHRSQLMNLYNRYIEVSGNNAQLDDDRAWTALLKPVWEAGHLLNRYVFPGAEKAEHVSPLHPLGAGHKWTSEDADLTSAIVVSLSASTKTGRGFAWQLRRNRNIQDKSPLGFLQATSSPTSLKHNSDSDTLPSSTVSYDALTDSNTISWIAKLEPKRIVIVDFGAASGVIDGFMSAIESSSLPRQTTPVFTLIGVGAEARVLSSAGVQERMASGQRLGKVQLNASGLRDRGIEAEGGEAYFKNLDECFRRWMDEKGMGALELSWGAGVQGPSGIEGAWSDICIGKMSIKEAFVFKL